MKQKIILLSANSYSIKDENTNRVNEGVSLTFLLTDSLKPVLNDNGSYGIKSAKCSVPSAFINSIVAAPGMYEADMNYSVDSNGRPTLKIGGLEHLGEIDVSIAGKK